MAPVKVKERDTERMLHMLNGEANALSKPSQKSSLKKAKFLAEASVRISDINTSFKKGYKRKYCNEVFKVTGVARPKSTSSDLVSNRLQVSRGDKIQSRFHIRELVPFQYVISQHRPMHQTFH